MSDRETLDQLLLLWQHELHQGRDLSAHDLCGHRPDLLPRLAPEIERLRLACPTMSGQVAPEVSAPSNQEPRLTVSIPPGLHQSPTLDGQVTVDHLKGSTTGQMSSEAGDPSDLPSQFEILGELGRGGMGVVYKARQRSLNRLCALKMILSGSHAGEGELARFRAEAEAVARVKHPGIIQVYDFGAHQGLPYLSMELCEGGSLASKLHRNPLTPREVADLVEQIARAVEAAHVAGIVHRDLKPGNILLTLDGSPRVTDFGLAMQGEDDHWVETGVVVGTPSYMAPEQAEGKKTVGPLTDVYSLGAILYECLTGRPPFRSARKMDTLLQVIHNEPVAVRQLNGEVPADLETICHKCLQKEPAQRYPSAAAFADDLRRWSQGEPILARPSTRLECAVKWARRNPTRAGLVGTALLAVGLLVFGAVVFALYSGQQSRALVRRVAQLQQVEQLRSEAREAELAAREARTAQQEDEVERQLTNAQAVLERAQAILVSGDLDETGRQQTLVEDSLDRVRHQLEQVLQEKQERQRRQSDLRTFQARLTELEHHRDELLFLDLSRMEGDRSARGRLIRERATTALAAFQMGMGQGREGLKQYAGLFTDAAQRGRAAGQLCELLLLRADAAEKPADALKDLDEAEALLRAEQQPLVRSLVLRRAEMLERLGHTGARAARLQAERQPPVSALDHFLFAIEHYRQGRSDAADLACEEALKLQPDYFWPQYLRGVCHLQAGRWARAEAWLSACVGRRPELFWPRLQRASARIELKEYPGAAEDLKMAEKGADQPVLRYVLRLSQARLAMALDHWPQARDLLTLAVKDDAAGFHAWANLAQVQLHLGEPRRALTSLDSALRLQPLARLYQTRADVHHKLGDIEQARADLAQAAAHSRGEPTDWLARVHLEQARLAHEALDHPAALRHCVEAQSLQPSLSLAQLQRARTLLALERHAEAGAALDAYLAQGKADASTWVSRGLIHNTQREPGLAIQAFTRAIQLERTPEALAFRGWAYLQTQALQLAQADFDAALEMRPQLADALCGRAQVHVRRGKVELALRDADAAQRSGKKSPTLLCGLAAVHARAAQLVDDERGSRRSSRAAGYQNRAAELLRNAVRLVPEARRPAFWEAQVAREPSFLPLLSRPELRALAPQPSKP
ncbi:MAG: protein kinase [Gemmataceae bacterium]